MPLEIYTMSRARLVLWASLPALLCGLMLIYFPIARHPGLLFALAVLDSGGKSGGPRFGAARGTGVDAGIAAGDIGGRSGSGVGAAAATDRAGSRQLEGPIERGGTEIYHRAPANGSQPSTRTEPVVSTTSPEGES